MASEWFTKELLRLRGSLFGFVLSIAQDFDLAEEVFQEVCVRILEREDKFEKGTNFGAWAREIARRTILEERRLRGRIRLSDAAIEAVAERYDAADMDFSDRRKALRKCLELLDKGAGALVSLRYEEGLSMAAIGHRLGRSAGAVQVALSRARAWLMSCIRRRLAMEEHT